MKEIEVLLKRLPLSQLESHICVSIDGEKIYIDGFKGAVSKEKTGPTAATIYISQKNLLDVLSGEGSAISLFARGDIEIDGNLTVAFKLKDLFG